MAVLEKSIQDKIDELSNRSYELYEAGEKKSSYDLMEEAWNLYPHPPENWNESYNTARYALDDLIEDNEVERALIWHDRMKKIQKNLGNWGGSYEFYTGKMLFAKGEFQSAKEYFDMCVKEGKGFRYFEGEDPKYRDFYLHSEKYIKQS